MASKTQMRLQQLTGSIADLAYSGSQSSVANPSAIADDDLGGVLGQFAGAIGRITGKNSTGADAFTNVTAGHFHQALHVTGSALDFNQAAELSTATGNVTLKSGDADVQLSAAAGDVVLQDGSTSYLKFSADSNDAVIQPQVNDKDIIFKRQNGSELARFDADANSLLMGSGNKVEFGATSEHISGDGSTLTVVSQALSVDASGAATIDSNAALTLGGQSVDVDADGGKLALDGSGGIDIGVAADVAIDMNSAALDIDASGEVTLDGSAGIAVTSTEAAADAIVLHANNAAGGIDLNVNSNTIVSVDADSVDIAQNLVLTDGLDVTGLTTLRGDLQVLGTTTTVSSSNTEFVDALIGLNYSGSAAGPDRDLGLLLARQSGNKVFMFDQTQSAFVIGDTSNNPDDVIIALDSYQDMYVQNLRVSGSSEGLIQSADGSSALKIENDGNRVIVLDKLRVDGGVLEDSDGDERVSWANNGDVVLHRADGTASWTINGTNGFGTLEGELTVQGDAINGNAGANIALHSGGDVDIEGQLKVKGNHVLDSVDAVMLEFDGSNTLALSGSTQVKLVSPVLNASDQTVDFQLLDNDADALQFSAGGNSIAYVNYEGIELQRGSGEGRSFAIYDGVAQSFSIATAVGETGNLTGSFIQAGNAGQGEAGAYLQLLADDVTGSAGDTMTGGLFFADTGFNVKSAAYSWSNGILFASGSAQYDDFINEFGANATILSALKEAAGGSAIRNNTEISSQVAAGGTVSLGADLSGVPAGAADERVQLFVNGQLMLSGAAGSNDYTLLSYGASTDARFTFIIEADDVVTVLGS